jgi:two-component system, chemotaxis family, sensor kinase CheA
MSSIVDESIISDFVAESREHLNAIEPDLLVMEQSGADLSAEVINRVFRAIHSIKGGAGFLAFEKLKGLSHIMESVLMQVRDRRLQITPPVMDALFAGMDRLRAMIDDVHASDSIPCEAESKRLKAILEGQGVDLEAQVTVRSMPGQRKKREFDLDAESVKSALAHGMNLFHATAYLRKDIKDKDLTPLAFLNNALSVGQCLDAYIDLGDIPDLGNCLKQDLPVTILFGTVLEADLAAMALNLPEAQVAMLDMKTLKKQCKVEPLPPEPIAAAPSGQEASEESAPQDDSTPQETNTVKGNQAAGSETLRVRVDLLTQLMNQAGELVLSRNQLLRALTGKGRDIPGLAAILQNINQVTTELQEGIMQTRMQPIGTVFNRFPRIIRDMSRQLGKQIDVQIKGAEVELDKSIVELLVDPLTHIIRNCADHALEPVDERKKGKKNPTGLIQLHAYHEGGQVNIAITDDGRGIDAKKVLQKALGKGVITKAHAEGMTDREIVNLVFAPGFSTVENVSDISGRGVGMDVVRSNTEKLGGHVDLETEVGMGTTVLLRLPLTLAIIPSMIVGTAEQRFAIPQVNVVEFVWVRAADVAKRIERVHGAEVLRLRDQLLPLIRLADVLGIERVFVNAATGDLMPDRRDTMADRREVAKPPMENAFPVRGGDRREDSHSDYNIVVLRLGGNQFGVVVDELFDIEEIVVKPLSEFVQSCKIFSGATILGDGRVIMILDAGGISAQAELHFADLKEEEKRRQEEEKRRAAVAASRRRSVLVCAGAEGEYFAIPQDRIMRLEKIKVEEIQRMGDREYVNYRGHGLPLLRLEQLLDVQPVFKNLKEIFLVIPKTSGDQPAAAGIVISNIVDALDVEVELEKVNVKGPGILGGAILQHHLTLFLEPLEMLEAAGLLGGERV